jgi:hypothetical protein
MEKTRFQFLKSLLKDCYNADRRRQRVPVDVCSYILARYWTDKHCPLWLMGRDALLKSCKSLAPQESWTEAVVKERIKKHRLCGFRPAPISGVRLGKGEQVVAFEVESAIYRQLGLTNFGYDFVPPLSGDLRRDACLKECFSASNLAKQREAFYAGAPRGYKKLQNRVNALQRRADIIIARISRMDRPLDDPHCKRKLKMVAVLNKVAAVVAASANFVKFRSGWVEPHFASRYQATEAKRPATI